MASAPICFSTARKHCPTVAAKEDHPDNPALARCLAAHRDRRPAIPAARVQIEGPLLWLSSAASDAGTASVDGSSQRVSPGARHWGSFSAHLTRTAYATWCAEWRRSRSFRALLIGLQRAAADGGSSLPRPADRACTSRSRPSQPGAHFRQARRRPGAELAPDLIGEHHVATIGDVELIEDCLRWIEDEPAELQEKRRRDLVTVLQRATQPEHGAKANDRAAALLDHLICMHMGRSPARWSQS